MFNDHEANGVRGRPRLSTGVLGFFPAVSPGSVSTRDESQEKQTRGNSREKPGACVAMVRIHGFWDRGLIGVFLDPKTEENLLSRVFEAFATGQAVSVLSPRLPHVVVGVQLRTREPCGPSGISHFTGPNTYFTLINTTSSTFHSHSPAGLSRVELTL